MSMKDFVNTLNKEQKKALLDALQDPSSVSQKFVSEEVNEEVKNIITEDFKVLKNNNLQSNSKRIPVRAKKNIWNDTGEDQHITTPETAITPRTRKAPSKKAVTCNSCGKQEYINKNLVYGDYYRCSRCVGK